MPLTPRRRQDAAIALAGLVALLLWDAAGLDLPLARWFGDGGGFAGRDHWLTSSLLHQGGRAAGWAALGMLVVGLWRPLPFARSVPQRERVGWVVATLACLLVVSVIKQRSLTSCPWSLGEFGGSARWVSHWAWGVADGGPGRCFPSGHASAAFGFLSGWFVLRDRHARAARAWLGAVLLAGAAFGIAQTVRGAHYPSHTLWTAWICWCVTALVWHAGPWRARAPAAPSGP